MVASARSLKFAAEARSSEHFVSFVTTVPPCTLKEIISQTD